jgi:hypothetical protein
MIALVATVTLLGTAFVFGGTLVLGRPSASGR